MTESALPAVPLTLEGSFVLHQFLRFRWAAWRALPAGDRAAIAAEAETLFARLETDDAGKTQTAIYSELGHKGDLVLMHFRPTLDALNQVELDLAQLRLWDYLELADSFVSVVEAGLYESTRKTYEAAAAKGCAVHSPEWRAEIDASLQRGSAAMAPRLFPSVPENKYLCFYPMSRFRGEEMNWYSTDFAERQRMMHEHGTVGRRYAGQVHQIITGALGFDDWEWGVTLFADDPISFKKIIYEMRFDEVSAAYGLFGKFYIAIRLQASKLSGWLSGRL